ncbi:TolC family protein [methane-oxidizing endosymbiont of Gigantopelta aegis]|uniref:TolC family protein n=1 Tax=methane-oxidizing endosymbiont of Gigantopelta aegis TaxID=2794938 RepID=UPI0018DD8D8E|nr:TolC family protein [methane-oxidizing endosymbiont of Gigantopelta aegis]
MLKYSVYLLLFVFFSLTASAQTESNRITEPEAELTLNQALNLAITYNPELSAYLADINAKQGLSLQAGLLPNPQLQASASNFGNNKFKGYDGTAITLGLSQLIELGGKRSARSKAAQLDQQLAIRRYENKRLTLMAQTAEAFIRLLAAQKNVELQKDLLKLSKNVVHIADVQVRVGNVSPLQATKARISLSSAQIALRQAERQLQNSRKQLAVFWGNPSPHFSQATGQLEKIQALPELTELLKRLDNNPDLKQGLTEINKRRANIEVEKSKAIPDVTLNVSGNNYVNRDDYNINAGFSIDLPVFDRNQGNIQSATHGLTQANAQYSAILARVQTELKNNYQTLTTTWQEIKTLKDDVIPNAEQAFQAAQKGYQVGEFNFLTVLDAQRTLFRVKSQYLNALTAYHVNTIRIEKLLGHQFASRTNSLSGSL